MRLDQKPWIKTMLFVTLVVGFLTSCAPRFDKGGKSQDEFDRDQAYCLQENTTKTAARYGPSRRTDWSSYALCMASKGYTRR